MKILKCQEGYKICVDTYRVFIPFLKPKKFIKNNSNKIQDLCFKELKNAKKFIEIYQKDELSLEDKLFAVNNHLKEIFQRLNINPSEFCWIDAWCGAMHWGIGISRLIKKEVFCADITAASYEPLIKTNDLVRFKILDTDKEPFPADINALFLRSTISLDSIKKIINNNPNLELVIIIPEGLCDCSKSNFEKEVNFLKIHFEESRKFNVCPDFAIKGSHSNRIFFQKDSPVIFAYRRKNVGSIN